MEAYQGWPEYDDEPDGSCEACGQDLAADPEGDHDLDTHRLCWRCWRGEEPEEEAEER
jgi:hypothetical protein